LQLLFTRIYCSERLVLRGGAFRFEKDANGAADRHNRAGWTLRHQRDHPDYHFAIGQGGGRREDAMQILRRQAGGRGRGSGAHGGYYLLRHSKPD